MTNLEPRLLTIYKTKLLPQLKQEFKLTNDLAVPKVSRIVINVGVKEAAQDKGVLTKAVDYLTQITGQKPRVNQARLSIAGFSLRQGAPVGLSVTLRGKRLYQFMDKLFTIVLPRVRDFQGVKRTAFDQQANYNLGLREQVVFPEVNYDKIDRVRGLEITFVTNTDNLTQAERLLELLGMPFTKKEDKNG